MKCSKGGQGYRSQSRERRVCFQPITNAAINWRKCTVRGSATPLEGAIHSVRHTFFQVFNNLSRIARVHRILPSKNTEVIPHMQRTLRTLYSQGFHQIVEYLHFWRRAPSEHLPARPFRRFPRASRTPPSQNTPLHAYAPSSSAAKAASRRTTSRISPSCVRGWIAQRRSTFLPASSVVKTPA